jgi:hypothetical protein
LAIFVSLGTIPDSKDDIQKFVSRLIGSLPTNFSSFGSMYLHPGDLFTIQTVYRLSKTSYVFGGFCAYFTVWRVAKFFELIAYSIKIIFPF